MLTTISGVGEISSMLSTIGRVAEISSSVTGKSKILEQEESITESDYNIVYTGIYNYLEILIFLSYISLLCFNIYWGLLQVARNLIIFNILVLICLFYSKYFINMSFEIKIE